MLHGLVAKLGLVSDVFVGNAVIAFYRQWEQVGDAVKVFEDLPERNLVSCNSLIRVYSENAFYKESFVALIKRFDDEESLVPDVATLVTILPSCAREVDVEMGEIVHGLAVKLKLSQEVTVNNAPIDMNAKYGFSLEAQLLFEMSKNRNMVSWNSTIWNFAREGNASKAFKLLKELQMEDVEAKIDITILNVLPTFSHRSQLMSFKELHGYSFRSGFLCDELVADAFIAAYAKCEPVTSADTVLCGMETKTEFLKCTNRWP